MRRHGRSTFRDRAVFRGCCVAVGPPASLAEQLKQVLAERERRLAAGASPPHAPPALAAHAAHAGHPALAAHAALAAHPGHPHPDPVQLTNDLVDEIRQAVSEANARGRYRRPRRPRLFRLDRNSTFANRCTASCRTL